MRPTKAILVPEDGLAFEGGSFGAAGAGGAPGEALGEVVFNTSLTGYQEILTAPSYKGQIVVMTEPHIGNVGVNSEDQESRQVFCEGLVVREVSPLASNWRSREGLSSHLVSRRIPAITGIDRKSTRL